MSTYYAGLLADVGILLLGALSVYIILATGQLSLGNAAFMGIGAYLTSYLTVQAGFQIGAALLAAAAAAGALGALVGFPALRLKGIYLAMATLGFGEMVRSFFLNFDAMGGAGGFHGMPHISAAYIWTWAAGILLLVMVLERSRIWLEMRAIHDDETVAELVGLNTTTVQTTAFNPFGPQGSATTASCQWHALAAALEVGWEVGLGYTFPSVPSVRFAAGYQGECLFWVGRSFIEQGPFVRAGIGF